MIGLRRHCTRWRRAFLRKSGKAAPGHQNILRWFRQFRETGCLCKGKSTGRLRVSEEIVEPVRQSFVRSPQKSTVRAIRELGIPQKTVWNVLRRLLHCKLFRLQLLQYPTLHDFARRFNFCTRIQQAMEDDNDLAGTLIFSEKWTFNLSGNVNRHNVRVWGYRIAACHCGAGKGFTKIECLLRHIKDNAVRDLFLHRDGAPPYRSTIVRDFLNRELPHRWIERACLDDVNLLPWPPRSTYLTPSDLFLWDYVRDKVYVHTMPTTLQALQESITAAVTETCYWTSGQNWITVGMCDG
ncbi:hypothetical protein AVEN_43677-1 [Araneus ventricosus]|uniref:DUF4817 domain-containing protein n=1 Tax=Araneus ventricosus TaxID=182803 RepID=A0A4Y2IYY3_ARAVE|nr:hypothetical protein AVEN_43677-1 [Araneus ventricosus]